MLEPYVKLSILCISSIAALTRRKTVTAGGMAPKVCSGSGSGSGGNGFRLQEQVRHGTVVRQVLGVALLSTERCVTD